MILCDNQNVSISKGYWIGIYDCTESWGVYYCLQAYKSQCNFFFFKKENGYALIS